MDWLRFIDVAVYLALAAVVGQHWHNDRHHWIGAAFIPGARIDDVVGELVALGAYAAIPVLLIFQGGQFMRIKREEQVLEAAFGDDYRAYKAKTWL